jgi:hypothetical protein
LTHFIGGAVSRSIRLLYCVTAILQLGIELLGQNCGLWIGERGTITGSGRCATAGR